jgi:hypothetical protein
MEIPVSEGEQSEEEDCIVMLSEAQEITIESLIEGLKDAPAAFSNHNILISSSDIVLVDKAQELTVVPLMEIMKDAMKLVCQIDKAYTSLDAKASEIASAFSKIAPEHYATIDFMRYLLKLTDSLLDKLPQGRESNLVVLLEHFEQSRSSTKIITNMTVQDMVEEEQHETEGGIVSSSSSKAPNFKRKRGGSFPSVSEINVNFLAVLANKINQQVYIMRVEKCTTRFELQQLVNAPIFNPKMCRQVSKPSPRIVAEFTEPVLQAINAKLATFSRKDVPGDDEEEEGNDNAPLSPISSSAKSDEEKQEGGGSASKRSHPQEETIKITREKQVSVVHPLPTNPLISGKISSSFPDLAKKHRLLVEEVIS